MEKTSTISQSQLKAGLLLKYPQISPDDFLTIVVDFEQKTNIDVSVLSGLENRDNDNYIKALTCYNNDYAYTLKEQYKNLGSLFNNKTIREHLEGIAGPIVLEYVKSIDIDKVKAEMFSKQKKENIRKNAKVLLITDNPKDYEEMRKYGFENIDYFESIILAEEYFNDPEHPENKEMLSKYHLIINRGNQSINKWFFTHINNHKIEKSIDYIHHGFNNHVTVLSLWGETSSQTLTQNPLSTTIYYYNRGGIKKEIKTNSYKELFTGITSGVILNQSMEKAQVKDIQLPPIEHKENPNRLPLPKEAKELKILDLCDWGIPNYIPIIAEKLGLNITSIKPEYNSSDISFIKETGNYDIIIGKDDDSGTVLDFAKECANRSKKTGRDLITLITSANSSISTYDENDDYDRYGIGNKVTITWKHVGKLAPDSKTNREEYRVLRQQIPSLTEKKYELGKIAAAIATYSEAVHIYHEAAKSINDVDNYKTGAEFDNDYAFAEDLLNQRRTAAFAPIKAFDEISDLALSYLDYQKKGLIKKTNNFDINEGRKNIKITFKANYPVKFAIVVPKKKEYKPKTLRTFYLQTVPNHYTKLGFYTSAHTNLSQIPRKPSEKEQEILTLIYNAMNTELKPLILDAEDGLLNDSDYTFKKK